MRGSWRENLEILALGEVGPCTLSLGQTASVKRRKRCDPGEPTRQSAAIQFGTHSARSANLDRTICRGAAVRASERLDSCAALALARPLSGTRIVVRSPRSGPRKPP